MIGSTWNKWDLHVHSPFTNQNNQFENASVEEYVECLISNQISLIGLTNYFYFAENELELIRAEIKRKKVSITVLGNIEFRISQPNKDGEWINIHCIFAEHISTSQVNDSLSRLEVNNTGGYQQAIYCCQQSFKQNNISPSDVVVDFRELEKHLKKSFRFGVDYLIAVCPNGYGGFRPNREGRSIATAMEIEKKGQLILGNQGDRDFFLKELTRYQGAVPKPVFCCSDAHSFQSDAINGRFSIGEKYTWVKAKPSFEGLRQALIEPEVRVQQSDDFIERTFNKPRFTSIELAGTIFEGQAIQFQESKIPLNPNMVAIIGGRGTGKSLFLDSMHSMFNHNSSVNNTRNVSVDSLRITLDQGDGTEITFDSLNDTYSYLHVSQGAIQTFSQEPSKLSDEIKKMLGINSSNFDPVTSNAITENLGKYRSFVQYWELSDESGNWINTPEYQNAIKEKYKKLMATITNPQNKIHIEQYQSNLKLINEKQLTINELKSIQSDIYRSVSELNDEINRLNQKLLEDSHLPLVVFKSTVDKIKSNNSELQSDIIRLQEDNSKIVHAFHEQGINQDISSLLDKISEYQFAIDTANSKLKEIQAKTAQYNEYVKSRADLVATYRDYLISERLKIDEKFQALKVYKPSWNKEQNDLVASMLKDIDINGKIVFDINSFYLGLESCLNRGKFRATQNKTTKDRLEEMFSVRKNTAVEDFFNLIAGNEQIICEGLFDDNGHQKRICIEELLWKSEFFNQGGRFELLNYLFSPESIKKYLYVNAEFEYKGKTVDKLSVGQRGTFYVCLKLATDPFGSPFVFDQPEDDLDNDFIMTQLVPLFRNIKKYRQVIIVTHNANLVVNTDAEQIIVANNDSEVISYDAGALEDGNIFEGKGTKASICNILEGGSYAFEKRERKYGIQAFV